MADTEHVTVASNILGTIGTVLWCIQLIPQIWYNWRQKKTDGLPPSMMFLWASCTLHLNSASRSAHGSILDSPEMLTFVLQKVNIPLQIQPQIFGFFSLVSWGQVLYYNHNYSQAKAISLVIGTAALFGGLEALLILTLRVSPGQMSSLASLRLFCWLRGFYRHWFFLAIDTLGGLFSLFALAAQGTFDILGGVMYIIVVVLEVGIYASHIVWRFRYRKLRKEAKAAGVSIDEMLNMRGNETDWVNDAEKRPGDNESQIAVDQRQVSAEVVEQPELN
ncbi:PQ-loop repeat-containing protein [Aspergillus fumigatus Af293]|uniref:PQ loop repeat protein n=2 Tax=Aspergillus fumigatus TaxID=746128 RepID=Q4WUG8_ASPFU|nr:PQ loop repeat protein [Aspergillus fumigatus Af293]EAL91758.1 PQ loop repeat protein [Aspergillus fumigatus Af293]EDP51584.1 PQ loop repeat protein [Aspergillus fumigatus A1163]KEY80648.1 hypothetical protein PQ loop repeat protein [Aspergillus fumigatus]